MTMNDFRRLAAKIDQHMQQLAAEGVREPDAIMTRMMGYVPELHNIWVGAASGGAIESHGTEGAVGVAE